MLGRMPDCSELRRRWRRRSTGSGFDALALIGTEGMYDPTSGRREEATHHAQLFHLGSVDWWLRKHYPQSHQYGSESATDPDQPDNLPVRSVPLIPLRVD